MDPKIPGIWCKTNPNIHGWRPVVVERVFQDVLAQVIDADVMGADDQLASVQVG